MSLTVDASSPSAAIGSGASTVTGAFTPPDNTLLVAFCAGDANNGSLDEDQTVVDSTSTTWTKKVLRNGNGGACVTVHYRRVVGTSPGNITATLTDTKGSVAKRIFPRVFIDLATGIAPDIGATAVSGSSSVSVTTTVNNSWVWSIALTANATLTAGSGCTQQDEFGGFDSGDAVQTESQTSLTATAGTNVTNGLSGTSTVPHNVAIEIIPGSSSSAAVLPPPALRRRPAVVRPVRPRPARAVPEQAMAPAEVDQPRRIRIPPRRTRQATPIRAQVNPPIPVKLVAPAGRLRPVPPRRGKVWQTALVPPVVQPPVWLSPFHRAPARLPALRRSGRALQPPWPPQAPPANPDLSRPIIRHSLRFLVPRQRRPAAPPTSVQQPPAGRRSRTVQAPTRRGHVVTPVAATIPAVPPPLAPALIRRRRTTPWIRRPRARLIPWATSVECDCITHRPDTGTTVYDRSITTRPDTGITVRPCTC